MRKKTMFLILFTSLFLTMCSPFANNVTTYTNGLRCENQRGLSGGEGADCTYVCPDGSVKQTNVSGSISPLYAASREELDAQLCGVTFEASPTEALATIPPTGLPSGTPAASPTVQATSTAGIPLTAASLLTGAVTMCDTGIDLISFRLVQPPPDLTGKTLTVQIAEQESMCYVNQVNPSLLTCTIPSGVTFPARVVASLDGAVTNDFTYDGLGCAQLTTPMPTTTP